MSTAIVPKNDMQLVVAKDWESKLDLIRRTVAKDATDDELGLFLHQCHKTGLDPLARQIYFVKRQGKGTIQTGIDGYRLVADRTGKYAGNDDPEFDDPEGQPKWAKVTVYKVVGGVRCPFTASARWSQYYPGDAQGWAWKKMPHLMLGKCAEALALRKAFPAELSGVYTAEEMEQAGIEPPMTAADGHDTVACQDCGKAVDAYEYQGKKYPIGRVLARGENKHDGAHLCMPCQFDRERGETAAPVITVPAVVVMPPELEWNTPTEGIWAGTVTGIEQPMSKDNKKELADYFVVKMGEQKASCWHKGKIREAIVTNAPGQVCGFNVKKSKDGKYVNIEAILKIGGCEYAEDGTALGIEA